MAEATDPGDERSRRSKTGVPRSGPTKTGSRNRPAAPTATNARGDHASGPAAAVGEHVEPVISPIVRRAEEILDEAEQRVDHIRESVEVPAVHRAEAIMDQAGERFGRFLLRASQDLRLAAALAREEAEDLWAEAQSFRRNRRSGHD